jgi:hypothetical protein
LRSRRVGDDEDVWHQRTVLTIERRHAFAGPSRADAQFVSPEPLEIERVHRVAELEQRVVGDVDDVVDCTHPGRSQSMLHPGW